MDSTEKLKKEIREIFENAILRAQQSSFPQMNEQLATYYQEPQHPDKAYYSFISTETPEQLTGQILKCSPDLSHSHAEKLASLAFRFREEQGDQSAELSPFIYVMY